MRILTNSNITAYGLSANTIPNRNMCTLTHSYIFSNRNIRTLSNR